MVEYNKILWDAIDEKTTASERSRARASFAKFRRMLNIDDEPRRCAPGVSPWFERIAAYMALPLAVLAMFLLFHKENPVIWQSISTRPGQTTQIVLSDNTTIALNGGSTLVYPSHFSRRERQVFFSGEGYFEVYADPKHPFEVLTTDARIKVKGTKFNLKSYMDDQSVTVALDEGKMAFEGDAHNAQHVQCEMVPGDNLSFNKETGTLKKNYSEADSGQWRRGEYYFRNETLGNISRDIERIFGVRVVVEREELLGTHYHIALVNGETADDFVRILSLDKSLSVSREGNTIIIK